MTRKEFAKDIAKGLTKFCRDVMAERARRGDTSRMDIQIGPCTLMFGTKKKRIAKKARKIR